MNDKTTPEPAAESGTSEAACSACPFCGTLRFNIHSEMFAGIRNAARVKCECGADGPRGFGNSQEQAIMIAITMWNQRPNAEAHGRAVARTVQPLVGASGDSDAT